ncbi:MAG: peptidylprolyl isomerase [Desulfomonilaceae bacterium]
MEIKLKKHFIIILSFFVSFMICQSPVIGQSYSDRIAAIVNSDVILESDVKKAQQPFMRSLMNLPLGIVPPGKWPTEREILDELIVIHLLEQDASRKGINLDERAVEAALESIKKRNNLTQEQFTIFLAANGMTYDDYKKVMMKQFKLTKLIESEVTRKTPITEEDAQKYFKEHKDEINEQYKKLLESMNAPLPQPEQDKPNIPTHEEIQVGGKIRLRQITLRIPSDKKNKELSKVMETAKQIYREAQTGADFGQLAKKYSQDPLAKSGGDLGFMEYKDMVPVLQKMVQRMKPGDITPPLQSQQAVIMFYMEDAKGRQTKSIKIPEKTRKALEKRWLEEKEKRLAQQKARSKQESEAQESHDPDSNKNPGDKSDPTGFKSTGVLNPEEENEYKKVRAKVMAVMRTDQIKTRMKEWIENLKKSSIIEVKM